MNVLFFSESIFDKIFKDKDKSIWIFVAVLVVLVVALLVVPLVKNYLTRKNTGNPSGTGNASANSGSTNVHADSAGVIGEHSAFSRWCPDNQPVIVRSPEQQKLVDKYFIVQNIATSKTAFLGVGVLALIVGIVLAIVFFATGLKTTALLVVGLILAAVGVVMFVLYSKSKKLTPPSDIISHTEYEQMVKTKIKELNVGNKGLLHLGLDEDQVKEIEPLVFTDCEVTDTSLVAYDASTGKIHSSTQNVMLVYFTDEQLLVYKLRFDMCCNKQEEWTAEFFYVDICDVSTYINKNVLDLGVGSIDYSTIKANIVATNSEISITMENDKTRYASIHAMRQKIRERKM